MVITGNYSTSTNHVVQHLVECASSVLSSSIPNLWSLVWSNTLKERLINIPSFALMLSKSKANGEGFEVYQQQRIHREAETARRQSESVDYHICRKYGRWSPQHSICFELWVPGGSIHGDPALWTGLPPRQNVVLFLAARVMSHLNLIQRFHGESPLSFNNQRDDALDGFKIPQLLPQRNSQKLARHLNQ